MRMLGLVTVTFLSIAVPAHGATIAVPGDVAAIQGVIDAASVGDTVVVAPGVYHEEIDFKGKAITVRSESGPDVTVLEGDFDGTVVRMTSDETRDTVFQGFYSAARLRVTRWRHIHLRQQSDDHRQYLPGQLAYGCVIRRNRPPIPA